MALIRCKLEPLHRLQQVCEGEYNILSKTRKQRIILKVNLGGRLQNLM